MDTKGMIEEEVTDLKDLAVDIASSNVREQVEDWGGSLAEDPQNPRRSKLAVLVGVVAILLGIGAWALLHSESGM